MKSTIEDCRIWMIDRMDLIQNAPLPALSKMGKLFDRLQEGIYNAVILPQPKQIKALRAQEKSLKTGMSQARIQACVPLHSSPRLSLLGITCPIRGNVMEYGIGRPAVVRYFRRDSPDASRKKGYCIRVSASVPIGIHILIYAHDRYRDAGIQVRDLLDRLNSSRPRLDRKGAQGLSQMNLIIADVSENL